MGRLGKRLAALAAALCTAHAEAPLSLTVMIYNYSDIVTGPLAEAEGMAARSYGAAGISGNSLACPDSQEDTEDFRVCDRANAAGSPYIKIYPETMAAARQSLRKMDHAMGAAAGSGAIIVYPRVRAVAKEWNCPEELVLGRILAHELGHILLGNNSHTSQGLMKPLFGRKEVFRESGQFLFEVKQAGRLREAVRQRSQK